MVHGNLSKKLVAEGLNMDNARALFFSNIFNASPGKSVEDVLREYQKTHSADYSLEKAESDIKDLRGRKERMANDTTNPKTIILDP